MLLHLPDGYTPELVRDALAAKIKTLPEVLRRDRRWQPLGFLRSKRPNAVRVQARLARVYRRRTR